MEAVNIDEEDLLDLGLGRSIYSKEQVEEFLRFQDSQGTRKAYLAETAELAYSGRSSDGTWGLGMGERARAAIIDAVGLSLVPLYSIVGPTAVTLLFLMFFWGVVRLVFTIIMRAIAIYRARGAGLWILGAFWSLPFQLLITPFSWIGYPAAALEELDRSGSTYPPFIPSFMRRPIQKDSPEDQ